MSDVVFTPHEIHRIAAYLRQLKKDYRENGIHWETVTVVIDDDGKVFADWLENQGGPYLDRVPISEFILEAGKE